MEISDFIKILFGAAMGFGANWFQSRLRRDEDRLKLYREKLELLYSDVDNWLSTTSQFFAPITEDRSTFKTEDLKVLRSNINTNRISLLIRFYADGLLDEYEKCWKNWNKLIYIFLKGNSYGFDKIFSSINDFLDSCTLLKDAIVNESKKYVPQSFGDKCKGLLPNRFKPRAPK